MTSHYIPSPMLVVLVRESSVQAKTIPQWNAAIDAIEKFARLSEADAAWLSGVRYMGCYTRPHV